MPPKLEALQNRPQFTCSQSLCNSTFHFAHFPHLSYATSVIGTLLNELRNKKSKYSYPSVLYVKYLFQNTTPSVKRKDEQLTHVTHDKANLRFMGTIRYCQTEEECSTACEDLM
jgi:hypothetical protein